MPTQAFFSLSPRALRVSFVVASLTMLLMAATPVRGAEAESWLARSTLTGDWGGRRPSLAEDGVSVSFNYASESAKSFTGGRDTGSAYTQQLQFALNLDLEKIYGIPGGKLKFGLIDRHGDNLSADRIGSLSKVQGINGGGLDFRIADLAYQQTFADKRGLVSLGFLHSGGDFATLPITNNFQNFVLSPRPSSLGENSGFSGYPVGQWGLRARWSLNSNWAIQAGVYEVNHTRGKHNRGWDLGIDGHGALIPVELSWTPGQGRREGYKPGLYMLGAYYDTSNANDIYTGERQDRRWGAWFAGQQMVWNSQPGTARGLYLFTDLHLYDRQTAKFRSQANIGLIQKGTFASRPEDALGLGVAYLDVNPRIARLQRLHGEIDPMVAETTIELYYSYEVAPWLTLQPNVQYINRPGGTRRYDDAWVGGITVRLTF